MIQEIWKQILNLKKRKLHEFSPWAWTPANHEITIPLHGVARHVPDHWNPTTESLFRKSWSTARLSEWLDESTPDWFTESKCVGIPIFNETDVATACSEIGNRGYRHAIFKRDLSSSGRGQRRLPCDEPLNEQDQAWVRSELRSGNSSPPALPFAVVEPELNRLIDLSFLWQMPRVDSEQPLVPKFLGWTRPIVTPGRRYAGTRLGTPLLGCDERIKRFLLSDKSARIEAMVEWLTPRLSQLLENHNFSGYFGVDAIVCQSDSGELAVKPLVELNPRMTMGHIAKRLEKRLASGVEAKFCILTKDEWESSRIRLEQIPFRKSRDGRWQSGVVKFCDVDEHSKLVPLMLVGREALSSGGTSCDSL